MNNNIDINIFSPTSPFGLLIIVIGIIFTGIIFYVIYAVSTNKESLEDKRMRNKRISIQKEKINRLYPK